MEMEIEREKKNGNFSLKETRTSNCKSFHFSKKETNASTRKRKKLTTIRKCKILACQLDISQLKIM